MAVNSMTKEQVYTLLNAIHAQATGDTTIAATDYSSFVSVAQATLQAGTEPTLNAITQVLARTIIAVRPYDEKFKGLQYTAEEWGGIIRKINFADRGAEADQTHSTTDGLAVDQFVVRKPAVLETRYVGSDVYQGHYTIYREQLKTAFENEANFGSFMSGLLMHFMNERTQWLENLKRGILVNAIAAKADMNVDVINLRSEYNTATGQNLTDKQLMLPANYPAFMKWAYARVAKVSREFTARSQKYQVKVNGLDINRHTPYADQRVYFLADFLEAMTARVLADAYHDNFLTYSDVEGVDFWQAIDTPDQISAKPVYIDATGAVNVASANVALSNVVGIIFDRDALGYNIFNDVVEASPYNAAGQYYNLFAHMDIQLQNDFTEKIAVFTLN